MKKTLFMLSLAAAAAIGGTAHAEVGDVIGEVYTTDIVATLGGNEIASANIGGETMIALRDLEDFNFSVWYEENSRSAIANSPEMLRASEIKEPKSVEHYDTVGEVIGNVYETDITAYVNGFEIPSVNIGGATMVSVRDLGDMTDSPFVQMGLSKYGFSCEWNEADRRAELQTFPVDNLYDMGVLAAQNSVRLVFDNTTLAIEPNLDEDRLSQLIYNDENNNAFTNNSDGSVSGRYSEMYYTDEDGERIKIGVQYQPYQIYALDDGYGNVDVSGGDGVWRVSFDEDMLKQLIENADKPAPLTYDEIIEQFENGWNMYNVYGKFETDDYAVIAAAQTGLTHGNWYYAVFRIGRDGSAEKVQGISSHDSEAIPTDFAFEDGVLTYNENGAIKHLDVITGEVTE